MFKHLESTKRNFIFLSNFQNSFNFNKLVYESINLGINIKNMTRVCISKDL